MVIEIYHILDAVANGVYINPIQIAYQKHAPQFKQNTMMHCQAK